jgi:UDP-glucose 4-epimerase
VRVLITGASGYIGGEIAARLSERGYETVGLSRTPAQTAGLAQQVQIDIGADTLAERLAADVAPCAVIIHAAATLAKELSAASVPLTNCVGTQQILKLAETWKVRRFVYLSSLPVIGIPERIPIDEDHPTRPNTAYHASKLFGEHLVRIAARSGICAVSLRLTSPVGPGAPPNRIFSVFVRRALTNEPLILDGQGSRRQDYVDVRDIAAAVEACLTREPSGILNIASGNAVSNRQLAEICVRALGSRSAVMYSGRPDYEEGVSWDVSIARAGASLDYAPRWHIEDSITALAEEIKGSASRRGGATGA